MEQLHQHQHQHETVPNLNLTTATKPVAAVAVALLPMGRDSSLATAQSSCISITTTSSAARDNPSAAPHHHLSLDQQQSHCHSPISPKTSLHSLSQSTTHFDSSSEMVRHTTKLLKSRDSRTGRLIINQYMKGKEIGRGVHGIVYIGKNMDKLIRTSSPQQHHDLSIMSPIELNLIHQTPSLPNSSSHLPEPETPKSSSFTEEDYETVAIKVVRREPKGPKSLRRSQMERQQQREAAAQQQQLSGAPPPSNSNDHSQLLSPPPSTAITRVPLLKDVDDKLKKEIAIMKRLRHKHIVQLKEVIDDAKSKKVFMILEFMEGGQVLWQDPLTQTPLMTVEQARNTFRQVLLGLEYLHYQSIIHRDIKPANLLWTADRETVKISDFGVSHISGVLKRSASNCNLSASIIPTDGIPDDSPRTTNSIDDKALRKTEGSPAFMAPELCCPVEATPGITPPEATAVDYFTQRKTCTLSKTTSSSNSASTPPPLKEITPSADSYRLISLPLPAKTFARGERPVVGKAIDIWALGVTLYCLLFGRTPFNAPNEYELFNVIWNEPIRVPDTMGIERQSLQFDPLNRNLDGPVQRDSRELIDLLRKLLEKDPRKRIKLDDVKVHPWVLNNLDNTQHWVHETAPVGGDAVYVTTEEVANFSRPRASLTTHKPLFGVKQSLRKAAIKLGLQRPTNKITRMRSKSASSGASGSPSPQIEGAFPVPNPRHSPLTPNSRIRQKISIDTSHLPSSNHPRPETPPITPSLPHSFPLGPSASLKRSFGVCSGWSTAITPKPTNVLSSSSSRENGPPYHGSPIRLTNPTLMNTSRPQSPARVGPSQSCLSSVSSRSGSPSLANGSGHPAVLPVPPRSSSPNTFLLATDLDHSIHARHPHMLLDPISFSLDKNNHRRSLPSSPAPIHALTSLSRASLVPPRTASPAGASSETEYHARVGPPPTWFRDALFRVKRRFTRSPHRRNSHLTEFTTSDDLERAPIQYQDFGVSQSHSPGSTSHHQGTNTRGIPQEFFDDEFSSSRRAPSEVFSSDAEPHDDHDPHARRRKTAEGEGGEGEDEEDEDSELAEETLGGPLMYHDGSKWKTPGSTDRRADAHGGQDDWLHEMLSQDERGGGEGSTAVGELGQQRVGVVVRRLSSLGLECGGASTTTTGRQRHERREGEQQEVGGVLLAVPVADDDDDGGDGRRQQQQLGVASCSSTSNGWGQPRLTFRPASVEYRSSDDDEVDEDDRRSERWRWKDSQEIVSSRTSLDLLPPPDRPSSSSSSSANSNPTPPPPPPPLSTNPAPILPLASRIQHSLNLSHQHLDDDEDEEDEEEEDANNTLQIEVKRRKRGCSRSEGS
ncbi:hypothetical protein PCANC_23887 [Puccinia coronata f. sp. avenae]|uniref:Protein kinase domain-containing protein n=1 Tax=Puccinia coronata f. sp. avenae TaxID=200324 RepID=A0A2N5TZ78_9BASI|nr:hypothetical protein PCANC_23887 [Puccinia coronata f. sp. avenae]